LGAKDINSEPRSAKQMFEANWHRGGELDSRSLWRVVLLRQRVSSLSSN